jgi:predicted adenine nucleotide alpha hydrolase (AANH) superfamily ATPase
LSGVKLFLHSCCGPCTLYPLQALREEGYDVMGYFDNPNIHPYREFMSRLEAYRQMADRVGLPARIDEAYGIEAFMRAIEGLDEGVYRAASPARCGACYRIRLERTAAACVEEGYDTFCTTLLVSPYQEHDQIREIGESIAAAHGLDFLYRDFRSGFRQGQAMAKEMGLYMQGYCGCVFSEYARYGPKKPKP